MMHKMIPVTRRADITFHADGRIDICAHVSRQLGMESGDVIGIATTDGSPGELLLYVARRGRQMLGRHACTCKSAKGHGRYLRVHSKSLAHHVLSICHATGRIALFVGSAVEAAPLGTALPLITAPYAQPVFIDPKP